MKIFLTVVLAIFFNRVHSDWVDFFNSKEKLDYVYPADFTCVSEVQFDNRYIFKLNKESDLLAIHDGNITFNKKKKQIFLTEKKSKIKIVYENVNLNNISFKNNDFVKKGDVIGKADEYIFITIKENNVLIDNIFFKYIN